MKTSLPIAALAALALSAPAAAQSSLSLFGIADAGWTHGSGSLSSRNQLTSGNHASSRIGFRGREDLGGGLSASFWLEGQFNTDNGSGAATSTNNRTSGGGATGACTVSGATPAVAGVPVTCAATVAINGTQGLTFNRRSTVSLAGPWGELRLGRDYTGHYRNRVDTDPFGVVGVGATQVNVGSLAGQTSTRASNALGYFLPQRLGGFFGQVQYYPGENPSAAAAPHDGNGYSVRAGYAGNAWTASAAYARQEFNAGDIVSTNAGGSYDAKVVRLMGAVFRDRTASATPVTARGYTLGAVAPVGAGELKFALSRYGSDAGAHPTARKVAVGYVHHLSRRTALYATHARVRNSGGATTALGGSTTAANRSSTGFDLGVRHSF